MKEQKEEITLSKVIDMDKFNEYGNKVCILGGVGSGKNRWVRELLTKKGTVLLITSRRANVNEIKQKEAIELLKGYSSYQVCTNALIGFIFKEFDSLQEIRNIIRRFDYIVLDEAHSLVTDASFTDSPFYVRLFIEEALELEKKVILMTGTYSPIKKVINEKNGWRILDYMDVCRRVKPKMVTIDDSESVLEKIKTRYKLGEKFIYLINNAASYRKNIYDKLIEQVGIPANQIAVIMNDDKKDDSFTEDQEKISKRVLNSLQENQLIPDDIYALITTSKLKEGINIQNKDIAYAYCESHYSIDMVQFCGRIREAVTEFTIISNASQFSQSIDRKTSYDFSSSYGVESLNSFLKDSVATLELDNDTNFFTVEDTKKLISFVHSKFDYIRFNPFDKVFELYEFSNMAADNYLKDIEQGLKYDSEKYGDPTFHYREFFDDIFGKGCLLLMKKNDKEFVDEYIKTHRLIGKEINKTEYEKILDDFYKRGIRTNLKKRYKKLDIPLEKFGYEIYRTSSHNKQSWKIKWSDTYGAIED